LDLDIRAISGFHLGVNVSLFWDVTGLDWYSHRRFGPSCRSHIQRSKHSKTTCVTPHKSKDLDQFVHKKLHFHPAVFSLCETSLRSYSSRWTRRPLRV